MNSTRKTKKKQKPCIVEQCPPGICLGAIETVADRFPWHLEIIGDGRSRKKTKGTLDGLFSKDTKGGI